MAAGNTAYAVLGKAPGVFIDAEGNIQLNGQSGIMVMIDGKQTYLSARDLRTMLEAMPAENLKNIEIITNPVIQIRGRRHRRHPQHQPEKKYAAGIER
jgi:hypothetical protein